MSEEERYGYGIDIGYDLKEGGEMDFKISDSGDIALIGGSGLDPMEERRKNAKQQIALRILTPFGRLLDEQGDSLGYGSSLYTLLGGKNTYLNRMALRTYVMACLGDYEPLESVTEIGINIPEDEKGVVQIRLRIKLKDDTEILFQTITLGE